MLWKVVDRETLEVKNLIEWDKSVPWSAPLDCVIVPESGDKYAYAKFVDPKGPVQVDRYIVRYIHRFLLKEAFKSYCDGCLKKMQEHPYVPKAWHSVAAEIGSLENCWLADLSGLETIEQLISSVPEVLRKYWSHEAAV